MTLRRHSSFCAATVVALLTLTGAPAGAEAERAGAVGVVDPSGDPIDGGGSATEFRFELAPPAECPGDSHDGNYRYHTFMVPENRSPAEISYNGLGPVPQAYDSYRSFRMPLYDVNTADVTAGLTAEADVPGGPGPVANLPVVSFHVYRAGEMPLGRYRIGVVCTHLNDPERYWDAVIDVHADASDEPAGIAWSLTTENAAEGDSSSLPLWLGAAAMGLTVAVLLARSRRTNDQRKTLEQR